jgi:methylmalonyl-CoA mutase C-terminal domain/subunit
MRKNMVKKQKIRVLMAIPGFDGHWRGAATVTAALRDAGMEVVFLGQQQPDAIAEAAIEEDVNVVGLSLYAAGHLRLVNKVIDALAERGGKNKLVIVGGTIPQPDIPRLKALGVGEVFPAGSPVEDIVDYVKKCNI